MSGRGGERGTVGYNEAKDSSNKAANKTARLQNAEINNVVQDLISRVEEKSNLNFLCELALKAQTRKRKCEREQNEREKLKNFINSVSHGVPS